MTPKRREAYIKRLLTSSPNLLIPHFLIHSYLYYVKDKPLVSDRFFDEVIVRGLEEHWERLEHPHKSLIDPSLLNTGFYLKYPPRVRYAAAMLYRELTGRQLDAPEPQEKTQ